MKTLSQKLLVVDDIEDWQLTISGVLQDQGYKVSAAGSVDDALLLLQENKYDLALLDLRLDERDEENVEGLELAKTIKNLYPTMKIVIVTGYGTPEILREAMEPVPTRKRLVDDYLEKDDTDKLVETVQRVLFK